MAEKKNISKTRDMDLCTSCEICRATCPAKAISMEYGSGQFLPVVDSKKCTDCGLCLEICPGIDIDPLKLRYEKDPAFEGPCLQSYTAYTNDPEIRKVSTSGGVISSLVSELLDKKEFDAAFLLPFDMFDKKPARLAVIHKAEEVVGCAKSKYIPASVFNVIEALKERNEKRYIIVGTSCQIAGIKKFIDKFKLSDKDHLFLGLFCEKTLNFNFIRYFEDTYKKPAEKLVKIEFRTKEGRGWPGGVKLYFDSGRKTIVNISVRMQLKPYFQLNRCLLCLDKFNWLSDISFGDAHTRGDSEFYGKSNVIIRTTKGNEIFDRYAYLFNLKNVDIEEIGRSQALADKEHNLEFVKIFCKKNAELFGDMTGYSINTEAESEFLRLKQNIGYGKLYDITRIRFYLLLSELRRAKYGMSEKVDDFRRVIGWTILIFQAYIGLLLPKKFKIKSGSAGRNVLIFGGHFSNKGAEAMLFTVIDQLKRRMPDHNIYLFSDDDFLKPASEKDIYKFGILPWHSTVLKVLPIWKLVSRHKHGDEGNDIKDIDISDIFKKTSLCIDISGYKLSSDWDMGHTMQYLARLIIARKYSIPYYILPQTIGPFNYAWTRYRTLFYLLLNAYLKYPVKIFVREKECMQYVHVFSKKNVEISHDIVLKNSGYDLGNIYKDPPSLRYLTMSGNSVGMIPSLRMTERLGWDRSVLLYRGIMKKLIDSGKTIYILCYASEDADICKKLKGLFDDNKMIVLVSHDLNTIELESVIKQFEFTVASRYHSIIHSYKNGVPALVIGWSIKYRDLMQDFGQSRFHFDIRSSFQIDKIIDRLDDMIKDWRLERSKLINEMDSILKEDDIFDLFNEINGDKG